MSVDKYLCPVCGYGGLTEEPWLEGESSLEICPSCGTQFGYDDAPAQDPHQAASVHDKLRSKWVNAGSTWFSNRQPPEGWDPEGQVRRLLETEDE